MLASPAIPPMPPTSPGSTVAFVAVVVAVVAMIVLGTRLAGQRLRESPAQRRRTTLGTALALALWLALTAIASASGALEAPLVPPPAVVFLVLSNLAGVLFAVSPAGARLARGLPIAALVGFHAFRLPLELVLHRWHLEGALPIQMTYEGRNLDILTGIFALVAGLWLWRRGPARPLVWAFNLVGLALLLNVMALAVLSLPLPTRIFLNDPPVLLAFSFPHGWIVPFCVAPALAGHILIFRWLKRQAP